MRSPNLILTLVGAAAFANPAAAADHVVKMLNKGSTGIMVFEPALVHAKLGDRVTFVPTDKSHNAETIAGMVPAGAAPFKGKMNQPLTVTFSKPGVYGYKCAPHYPMGMVGAVVVGTTRSNLAAVQAVKHPGKAKQVMAGLLARAR